MSTTQKTVLARGQKEPTAWAPPFVVMTDDDRLPDPSSIIPSLPVGSTVIIRSRTVTTRTETARSLMDLCRHHHIFLLVSCDKPPKILIGDGLHIPETARKAWQRRDFNRLKPAFVTTSAHSLASARHADRWGADAVLLSPILATPSHPDASSLGWWRGAGISRHLSIPAIALGGMTRSMAGRVSSLGFSGVAGISIFTEP